VYRGSAGCRASVDCLAVTSAFGSPRHSFYCDRDGREAALKKLDEHAPERRPTLGLSFIFLFLIWRR
jgi:hypothetical protein